MEPEFLEQLYRNCRLCPRNCGADRVEGASGFCGETSVMRLAWAGLHHGEEPPVSGSRGSGTLFFSGCTLGCAFCQNRQLSRGESGRPVSVEELTGILLELQKGGAENINFVTGTHFIPGILDALKEARVLGLSLPVVWNSSGYETPSSLALLEPEVDLWLPDLKTLDADLARRLFGAEDYPEAAVRAIEYMGRSGIRGIPLPEDSGEPAGGEPESVRLILRHLILPGFLESTREVLRWYSRFSAPGMLISVMTQYMPVTGADPGAPERYLTNPEAEAVYDMLDELGIEEGFFQGLPEDSEEENSGPEPGRVPGWQPDFNRSEPFPGNFARGIWFWNEKEYFNG